MVKKASHKACKDEADYKRTQCYWKFLDRTACHLSDYESFFVILSPDTKLIQYNHKRFSTFT